MVALSSLSVAAADSTAAGGRLTARPYITTCTNSPRERSGGGGVRRLREQETVGERDRKDPWGKRDKEKRVKNQKRMTTFILCLILVYHCFSWCK